MRTYLQITGVFFAVVVLVHLARLVWDWPAQIARWAVPMWLSWFAILATGALCAWAFRLLSSKPKTGSYLEPGRLADVLMLVQVLAYGPSSRRTDDGLRTELKSTPQSANSWPLLAAQHPEFFRVRSDIEKPVVSLVSRFVQQPEVTPEGEEKHPPLPSDIANTLMGLAVELHDREVRRSQAWHVYIPIIVAVTAGVFTLFGVVLKGWLGGAP